SFSHFVLTLSRPRYCPLFPYTTLFRSRLEPREELRGLADPRVRLLDVEDVQAVDPHLVDERLHVGAFLLRADVDAGRQVDVLGEDRKSTRLNSSHEWISYAVFCLKKKR